MKYVEIIADPGSLDTLKAIAGKTRAADLRTAPPGEDGMQQTRMLVADDRLQSLLDALQNVLGAQHMARISVLPIEVALPEPPEKEERARRGMTIYIVAWVLMLGLLAGVIYLRRVLPG